MQIIRRGEIVKRGFCGRDARQMKTESGWLAAARGNKLVLACWPLEAPVQLCGRSGI